MITVSDTALAFVTTSQAPNVNTYQLDTLIQLTGTFTGTDGVTPVDPTTVLLFVQTPDGIVTEYTSGTTPAITKVSTGVYQFQIQVTQSGPWVYKWQGTGAVVITSPDVYFAVAQSAAISG